MRAGTAYGTEIIKEGNGCQYFLLDMTIQRGDFVDIWAQVLKDAFSKIHYLGTCIYGTALFLCFSELVQNVPLDGIVPGSLKYSK